MKYGDLPYNLQFFAEGEEGQQGQEGQQNQQGQQNSTTTVDYDKIQQMLNGTLAAKEETALKAYFKQQGLSQEEVEQAITTFKQQKAAQQPDVTGLQQQATQAAALAQQKEIENKAILMAIELGVEAKTIPYLLKLADLNNVMGQDEKVNEESLKNALNKVLEEVPALKPSKESAGFQMGASGTQGQSQTTDDALKAAFGLH